MSIIGKFNELQNNNLNIKYENNVIGVLSEKTLHKTIKNLYEPNHSYQEIKIDNYFVDICKENNIIEVQTKQFNKLRDKITYLLSLNKYKINIVYPVFTSKMIYNISNGEISNPKKSPKKFRIPEVFHELYMIKQLLGHKDLMITLLLFEINEYREIANNRRGYVCYDRIPTKLIDEIVLKDNKDYINLLPPDLSETFTSKEICLKTKTNVKYVNKMLNVMKYLNVVEVVGKDGRKLLYNVKRG